jgi:putative membrane protein
VSPDVPVTSLTSEHKMKYVTGTIVALLLLAVIIFSAQNLESVDVTFLNWGMRIPKVLLILVTYVLGMISGWGLVDVLKKLMK